MEDVPGAFEEEEGVVVGGSAGVQVQGVAFTFSVVHQVLTLGGANRDGVEGDIVVDCVGVGDQAVVRDNLHAGSTGGFRGGGGSGAVMRADNQDFDTLGNQGFNVLLFLGGIALAEQDFHAVAGFLKSIFEAGFILDPAGFILGRQNNTDCQFFASGGGFSRCFSFRAGAQHHRCDDEDRENEH